MFLSLRIALRFYQGGKRNILASLISLVSVIVIGVGIAVSIIIFSIINGFEYELSKRILSIVPHGEITTVNNIPLINWKEILTYVIKIPQVINASPYIHFSSIIKFHNKWHLVYIKSVNLLNNVNIYDHVLTNFIEKDSWKRFCENKNQIILGEGVSIALNIKEGDWITVFLVNNFNLDNRLALTKQVSLQVSGILKLHSYLDNSLAIISLLDAQNYYNNRLGVDGIEFSVNNVFHIKKIIKNMKFMINKNIKISSWIDMYGYIYHDIQIVRIIIYLSVILIIGVSCFSVITVLILLTKHKNYDIAVLRAIGAQAILIQRIFLWYGFLIYCVSSVIGVGLGVLVSLILKNFGARYINLFKINFDAKSVYFIDFLPVQVHILDIYLLLIVVLLLGFLISWYGSLKVRKINLFRILR
ncbi:lipoprotein-releasing system transmembrane protein lolE [Candidatus Blochmanniella vafra str. BVAF]|uniref:Lipoprotein-releasing system transmembrane protein lolE n=1 Tax=Blochmanniella vafra (strain BVAF) TaxID=859654 RepID=E8Q696_BLOVB|nr:FtsX-like permease family protein [Candidatus Blochmannia vafer]ADV33790.1 lipoprotein-releasing system transmembrane protein lolE [Candidatus Blochmannia vafer str. BVAF]